MAVEPRQGTGLLASSATVISLKKGTKKGIAVIVNNEN